MKKTALNILLVLAVVAAFAQQKDTSFKSNGNPIITHKYTADPAAMVYKDTFYLYTGHDVAPKNQSRYEMHDWLCFSTTDMVNWKEHPSPLNVKDFTWAKDDAWASQVIERNGKLESISLTKGGKTVSCSGLDSISSSCQCL